MQHSGIGIGIIAQKPVHKFADLLFVCRAEFIVFLALRGGAMLFVTGYSIQRSILRRGIGKVADIGSRKVPGCGIVGYGGD